MSFGRNRTLTIFFNQEILRPTFLPDFDSEIYKIDAGRDIFLLELVLFGEEASMNLNFTVNLITWEKDRVRLLFNFSYPLLVSRYPIQDKLLIKFNDPSMFVSSLSGQSLSSPIEIVAIPIPRQISDNYDALTLQNAIHEA